MLNRFEAYLTLYRCSPKTIGSYLSTVRRFFGTETVTEEMVRRITSEDLLRFLQALSDQGDRPSTINQRLCALKTFFRWCKAEAKIIDENPAAQTRRLPLPQRAPEYLTPEGLAQAFGALGPRNYERNAAILCVAGICGLRCAEIAALNLEDHQDGTLRVVGKGNKERFVATSQVVEEAIRRWLRVRPKTESPALFVYPDGRRIETRVLRTISDQLSRATGMHIHPHLFRHTAGSLAYSATKDLLAVKELLGHARIETTLLYTHLPSEAQRAAVTQSEANQALNGLSPAPDPKKKGRRKRH